MAPSNSVPASNVVAHENWTPKQKKKSVLEGNQTISFHKESNIIYSLLKYRKYHLLDKELIHTLTSASVDSGRTESLPDDGLTDVGGNEKGDARAKTIALLQQLI